ncbi:MAG: hypothetical protein Q8L05_09220, partial [Actinomycetota bacterium]|nr:hypothetical protein [Actinomycetota bacterium]
MVTINRVVLSLGHNRPLAERVALFAAAAAVGPSFEPGLQPRKTIDQAIATGVISATTLSLVTAAESTIESLGNRLTRNRAEASDGSASASRLAFTVGTNLAVAGLTEGLSRLLPPHEDEKLRRGLARVAAQRSSRVALAGAALSAIIGSLDLLAQKSPRMGWTRMLPIPLAAGVGASAFEIRRVHRRAAEHGDATIAKVSTRNSVLIALGVGAGVITLQAGE